MKRGRRFLEMLGDLPKAGWPTGMTIALFVVIMSGETFTPAKAGAQQPTPATVMWVSPTWMTR